MSGRVSVLDIEVNDAKFKAFLDKWNKFKKELDDLPKTPWSPGSPGGPGGPGVPGKVPPPGGGGGHVTNNIFYIHAAQQKFNREVQATNRGWGLMVRSTASVAKNIQHATLSLLKWVGITSTLGALLGGGGGLWGISRLAGSAASARRSAGGLNASIGGASAFGVNFSRFVDPSSFLGGVAEARTDLNKQWAFNSLGVRNTKNRDTADIAVEVLEKARKIFKRGNGTEQYARQRGLLEFFSMEELRNQSSLSDEEFNKQKDRYSRDKGTMALPGQTARAWQDFVTAMERAGTVIERVFQTGLAPLAEPLTKLSEAFAKAVADILKSPQLGEWIQSLGDGVKRFADYLMSDDFKKDLNSFADSIKSIAKTLSTVAHWLANPRFPWSEDPEVVKRRGTHYDYSIGADVPNDEPDDPAKAPQTLRERMRLMQENPYHRTAWRPGGGAFRAGGGSGAFGDLENRYGLPAGLLSRIRQIESGGNDMAVSPAGAQGPFQFMPGTARQYGLNNPFDLGQSAAAAARYFNSLMRRFHGDVDKAAAGYNWGEGNVERVTREHGDDWRRYLPRETQTYLRKLNEGNEITVHLRLQNESGGNVIVSGAQLRSA